MWKSILQNDLQGKTALILISQLNCTFKYKQIACLLLSRELHCFNTWFKLRKIYHQVDTLLLYEWGVLTKITILDPFG